MCKNNDNSFCFAMGILAGCVAGIAAGVLLAPKSGEETRKEIKNIIDDVKEKYSPEIIRAKRQALDAIKETKDKIEDAYQKFNDNLKAKHLARAKNNETNVDDI